MYSHYNKFIFGLILLYTEEEEEIEMLLENYLQRLAILFHLPAKCACIFCGQLIILLYVYLNVLRIYVNIVHGQQSFALPMHCVGSLYHLQHPPARLYSCKCIVPVILVRGNFNCL